MPGSLEAVADAVGQILGGEGGAEDFLGASRDQGGTDEGEFVLNAGALAQPIVGADVGELDAVTGGGGDDGFALEGAVALVEDVEAVAGEQGDLDGVAAGFADADAGADEGAADFDDGGVPSRAFGGRGRLGLAGVGEQKKSDDRGGVHRGRFHCARRVSRMSS